MTLIYDAHEELCEWVDNGIYGYSNGYNGHSKAIGQIINGKLVSAVTYSGFQARQDNTFYNVEMGIYSVDKRWCNRHYLNVVFKYPFIQLGLERVQTICSANEEGVMMFNQKLGFKKEGLHRKAWHTGCDSISWSMLKDECKWI